MVGLRKQLEVGIAQAVSGENHGSRSEDAGEEDPQRCVVELQLVVVIRSQHDGVQAIDIAVDLDDRRMRGLHPVGKLRVVELREVRSLG